MRTRLLLIGVVAAVVGTLLGTAPASATTAPYAAQARAAGLTASQAHSLQKRVNTYLAMNKGSQVAFNKINLKGGGEIDLAYPGQVHPDFTCYVGDFCGYQLPNRSLSGDYFAKSACNSPVNIPWGANGSWWNNQTGSVRAKFYTAPNGGGSLWYTTPPSVSSNNNYNWAPVSSTIVC